MSDYNSSAIANFTATIQAGAAEAMEALKRAFDIEIVSLEPGKSGELFITEIDPQYRSPGLLMLPVTGGVGCAILIPKSTGLVPDWCDAPDATGKSKLSTLAQEWGMTLLPEDYFPDEFQAETVPDLIDACMKGHLGTSPGSIELNITKKDNSQVKILMVWPLKEPSKVFVPTGEPEVDVPPPPPIPGLGGGIEHPESSGYVPFDEDSIYESSGAKQVTVEDLPGFTRSLLKVKLPVAAVLAQSRRPIKMILELGVGSVVQFDKSCDSLLELQVGEVTVGTGEAVKIGDKFGLRVHNILLPEERFRQVEVRREGEYKKRKKSSAIIGKAPIRSLEPAEPS